MSPRLRWTPPPGWPSVPWGWSPPPGWKPDPSWPPAPPEWEFWQPSPPTGRWQTMSPRAKKITVAAAGAFAVLLTVALLTNRARPTSTLDEQRSAVVGCQKVVRDQLKAPRSAHFPSVDDAIVTSDGSGTYRVRSYVDADNSFGANIRTSYTCTARDLGDKWDVTADLEQ